jgi:LysM repeat protein
MRDGRSRRVITTVALTATLLVAVAACGGGGNQKPTSTPNDVLSIVTPTPGTPVPVTPTPGGQAGTTYTVREGDSLSAIAARFGVSEEAIQRANDIDDPNSIYAGQELIIPEP